MSLLDDDVLECHRGIFIAPISVATLHQSSILTKNLRESCNTLAQFITITLPFDAKPSFNEV